MERIDCLEVLQTGLPASAGARRDVVIIGAGMAGLTAGLLLKEAGHRVTILEAQNRLGGRVYTYRGFPGKMYGEFGAMRFPRQHELVQHLIQDRFGLETRPFAMYDEDTFIYLNNRALRRSLFSPEEAGFELEEAEAELLPADLLRQAVQPLIDLVTQENGWELLLAQYDRYSLVDYPLTVVISAGTYFASHQARVCGRWGAGGIRA